MSETSPFVEVSHPAPGIAEIRMQLPDRRNALTVARLDELSGALRALAADESVVVAVLSGEGRSFCAGADLHHVHNTDLEGRNEVGLGVADAWELLGQVPFVVIAAVQGHAITGGLQLALCCDLLVATRGAVFQDSHARWGLIPGSGEPQRYSRRLGIYRARELMFTARTFTGEEAHEWGVVSRLAESDEDLSEVALGLAREIADNNPRAVKYMKQMVNGGFEKGYGEAQWSDSRLIRNGRINTEPDADRDRRLREFRENKRRAADRGPSTG